MTIRAYVYASLALVAWFPAAALAQVLGQATIAAPPAGVTAGSTVQIQCYGEGTISGMSGQYMPNSIDVTVSGGTVNPAQIPGPATASVACQNTSGNCNVLQGSVSWTTPAAPATLTATCTVNYTFTSPFGGCSGGCPGTQVFSADVTTVAGAMLPPVVQPLTGPSQAVVGTTSTFQVTASDPNTPAQPLTYAWGASGGTITPNAQNPASAAWQAPADPGTYSVTATVSNSVGSVTATKAVSVIIAAYQAALTVPLVAPQRLAAADGGALFVVDRQPNDFGQVNLVTARGDAKGFAVLPEPALAAASGAGFLWVTTTRGSIYKVDASSGRTVGKLNLASGPFARPLGIAFDAASMTIWVADSDARRVRVIRPDGSTVATIASVAGAPLLAPTDVAINPATGRAWVLIGNAKAEGSLAPGEPLTNARFLHAFDLAGQYVGSYVGGGTLPGQIVRAGGLGIAPNGRMYVSDSFQGVIQVYSPAAAPVGTVGTFGSGSGTLLNPSDIVFMANGDLAVANTSLSRVDRFGSGVPLPTCNVAGLADSDCDGMSDAWELAHNLNPSWAGDALLDYDGDGLSNLEEFAHNTDPRNADTDGDGFSDRDELLAGYDPTNPNDHRPAVSASGPSQTGPGIVRLTAVAAGQGTCSVSWTQASGPAVTLRNAATATPSFIGRASGIYEFDAVATCGGRASPPARVAVTVDNVAPRADAGRVLVATPGSSVRLDALASSDANGDALAFGWDQTIGAPISGAETGGILVARPRGPGLYGFQVTVTDGHGGSGTAEVPVLVAAGTAPTAIAAASPASPVAGATVTLNGSASIVDGPGTYAWQQVAGPSVEIASADQPVASFVAAAAGRYAFELTVGHGGLRSPAARVDVFVADAGVALPTVTASAPAIVAVDAPVPLQAGSPSAGASFAWRQVSGPAAGLTDDEAATATAVPFAPGFYVFEVSVHAGAAESLPVRVAFEARAGGRAIPQARAVTPTPAAFVGDLVFLDGRTSTGALRYRWTQVGGPWVVLGTQAAVTSFRPLVPGAYAFELEVDDGTTRSAPARVQVNVSAEGVQ